MVLYQRINIEFYHVTCGYISLFTLSIVNGNQHQSEVFYLASIPTCVGGLLVDSQRLIFHIADPTIDVLPVFSADTITLLFIQVRFL